MPFQQWQLLKAGTSCSWIITVFLNADSSAWHIVGTRETLSNEWIKMAPQSHVSTLPIVPSKPSPLKMYGQYRRTETVRQRLNEMVWGHRRKGLHGWRETGKLHTKREAERTHTNPRAQSWGQAINRKVKMALLNTSDKINLVITTAEHRARRPHLLERSLWSC